MELIAEINVLLIKYTAVTFMIGGILLTLLVVLWLPKLLFEKPKITIQIDSKKQCGERNDFHIVCDCGKKHLLENMKIDCNCGNTIDIRINPGGILLDNCKL